VHFKTSVFAAVVDAQVFICSNTTPPAQHQIDLWIVDAKNGDKQFSVPQMEWQKSGGKPVSVFLNDRGLKVAEKMWQQPLLETLCNIT